MVTTAREDERRLWPYSTNGKSRTIPSMPEQIRPVPTEQRELIEEGSRAASCSPESAGNAPEARFRLSIVDVSRPCYVCWVKDRYSFTAEALRNLEIYDIAAQEVWEVLHASRRLTRHLDADAAAVFGVTGAGRYLVVLVVESALEANDWDVVAAREMNADEVGVFDRYIGRKP